MHFFGNGLSVCLIWDVIKTKAQINYQSISVIYYYNETKKGFFYENKLCLDMNDTWHFYVTFNAGNECSVCS